MQKQEYLYLKSSFLFFIFFIVTFNYPQLLYGEISPASVPFFKALSVKGKSDPEQVKSFLRESAINAREPVKSEARRTLLEVLYGEENYFAVSVLGETFLGENPGEKGIALFTALAFLELKDYNAVLRVGTLADYRNDTGLLYTVLMAEIAGNKPGMGDNLVRFLLETPVIASGGTVLRGPLKDRTKTLFTSVEKHLKEAGTYSALPSMVKTLLSFRIYAENRKFISAAGEAVKIISTGNSEYLSVGIADYAARIFALAGRSSAGIEAFERGISRGENGDLPDSILEHLYWGAGYLAGRRGFTPRALDYYTRGMEHASGSFHDKLLWYWYSLILHRSVSDALAKLDELTSLWIDPAYFSDLLSDLSAELIRKGNWEGIRGMLEKLNGKADGDVISRISYFTARAAREGFLDADETEIERWFNLSIESGEGLASGLYYKIMSTAALEKDSGGINGIFRIDNSSAAVPGKDCDELLYGAITFELSDYGKGVLENCRERFSLTAVRAFAAFLKESGDYINSIRILNRYLAALGYAASEDDIRILYPDAYRKGIEETALEEGIPVSVLYALIREESHFSADIVSAAGAVGLSQLMPSTAGDVASRMRMKTPVLTDPQINMKLGGWYLQNLMSRTDSVIQALFAYNGGLTRVRRWKKEYSALPEDLFLEAIPYRETSLYGRKVLVSAVIYGYLYHNRSLQEMVTTIFRSKT